MNLKRVLGWVAVAFVIWFIIEQPTAAAHIVHDIGTGLSKAASGLSTFATSL